MSFHAHCIHATIIGVMLTRAPLGYSAERAPLGGGGGADSAPPA